MDVDEALLTGESVPVNKTTNTLESSDIPIGDRVNMIYASTILAKGRGKGMLLLSPNNISFLLWCKQVETEIVCLVGLVTAVGMNTEIGKIARRLMDSGDNERTPLQRNIDRLAMFLFGYAVIVVIVIFGVSKFEIGEQEILYAISTAIASVPEGLMAVLTLTQAFGVHAMAKAHALVRRLVSLELLGSVTNICSDKTGTLTQSKMVLTRFWLPGTGFYKVAGLGFETKGEVIHEETNMVVTKDTMGPGMRQFVHTAALCNMSEVRKDKETGEPLAIGDPTEVKSNGTVMKMMRGRLMTCLQTP